MTCRAPDAPDGPSESVSDLHGSSASAQSERLLVTLGEALQILIHAQAQQAARLTELAESLQALRDSISDLIASDFGGEPEVTPEVGLDGQPIPRR